MTIEACDRRFAPVLSPTPASHCNQPHALAASVLPNPAAYLVYVHAWHAQVDQHDLRMKLPSQAYGSLPIMRKTDLVAHQVQEHFQARSCVAVVIDDDDLQFLAICRRIPLRREVDCTRRPGRQPHPKLASAARPLAACFDRAAV